MRFLALDIGDVWTGVAISDPSGIIARPYMTLHADHFMTELGKIIQKERITDIIIGYPETMRGTQSAQTHKIIEIKTIIETTYSINCIFIDERMTSQSAARLKPAKNKEEKQKQHAVAAAIILTSYLEYRYFATEDKSLDNLE